MSTSSAKKKKKKQKTKLIVFIIEIIVLLALVVALFLLLKWWKVEHTEVSDAKINSEVYEKKKELGLTGYTNIALFGIDNRGSGSYTGSRSDCIMVASINNDTQEVKIVSFYRDTYTLRPDGTYGKMNGGYGQLGPEGGIQTLNTNFDLDIEDYIAVDFAALIDAVNLVGGVEIDLSYDEIWAGYGSYYNYNFYINELNGLYGLTSSEIWEPGTYLLDGVQATAYCRIRSTVGDDFTRSARHREVLVQLIEKAQALSLTKVNELVDEILPSISTSLSEKELLSLIADVFDYELVSTAGFPFSLHSATINSASVMVPCTLESSVKDLYEYLYGIEDYEPSTTVKGISDYIINDTGYDEDDDENYSYGIDDEDGPSA